MVKKYETVEKVLRELLEELEVWKEKYGDIRYFSFRIEDLIRLHPENVFEYEVKKKTIYHVLKALERAGFLELRGKKWFLSEKVVRLLL